MANGNRIIFVGTLRVFDRITVLFENFNEFSLRLRRLSENAQIRGCMGCYGATLTLCAPTKLLNLFKN